MSVVVRVRIGRNTSVHKIAFKDLAETILDAVGESESELSIELVGDRRIRSLNKQYRGQDIATDVLAFALREAPGPMSPVIGDVVISIPTASRQAIIHRHSVDKELAILLIHGILHLCGYDHERGPKEAARMKLHERMLLKRVLPVPSLIAQRHRGCFRGLRSKY
jgi:probable rRNA maturation factor